MSATATSTSTRTSAPPAELRDRVEALYRAHHRFVWHSVRRMGVADASVEDAVHEVFVVVARRLTEFEGRSAAKTWIFGIALRVVQAYRRGTLRHTRRTEAFARERDEAEHRVYARSEAAATLHRILDVLDDDKRAAFLLAELEGMSAPEIAEATDTNVNTVYARLRAARQRVKEEVERLEACSEGIGALRSATARGGAP